MESQYTNSYMGKNMLGEVIAIEKEKFDPSLPTAFKMSKLFDLPIDQIFLFEG